MIPILYITGFNYPVTGDYSELIRRHRIIACLTPGMAWQLERSDETVTIGWDGTEFTKLVVTTKSGKLMQLTRRKPIYALAGPKGKLP